MELYSTQEMAYELGITLNAFYTMVSRSRIGYIEQKEGKNYYSKHQFEEEIFKYYPMKTTETFLIYESKMNEN
jgi:hypothetical protein